MLLGGNRCAKIIYILLNYLCKKKTKDENIDLYIHRETVKLYKKLMTVVISGGGKLQRWEPRGEGNFTIYLFMLFHF